MSAQPSSTVIYTNKWNVKLKCSRFRSPEVSCCCPLLQTLCKPPRQLMYTITALSKAAGFCIVSKFKPRLLNFSATIELYKKNGLNINHAHKTTCRLLCLLEKNTNLANTIYSKKKKKSPQTFFLREMWISHKAMKYMAAYQNTRMKHAARSLVKCCSAV